MMLATMGSRLLTREGEKALCGRGGGGRKVPLHYQTICLTWSTSWACGLFKPHWRRKSKLLFSRTRLRKKGVSLYSAVGDTDQRFRRCNVILKVLGVPPPKTKNKQKNNGSAGYIFVRGRLKKIICIAPPAPFLSLAVSGIRVGSDTYRDLISARSDRETGSRMLMHLIVPRVVARFRLGEVRGLPA